MASSSAPIVDRIRIIPRPDDFLDRNVGSSGEVFFNKVTNSLRVYSGKDVAGFEIARADLNNVTGATLLSRLTITNDDISWIAYAELVDLPSAADNHGMFAHVHGTGKAYYAHAGAWIELANQSDISSIADISELTDTTNLLFDGAYSSLTSPPTIPTLLTDLGITDGSATQILTTDGAGNFTFADAPETGTTQNLFATITSDDGSATANTVTDTLNVLGGTNIATTIATDTDNLTINMSAFSIDFLSDVDTTSSSPATGNVLKWDGAKWAPGVDATTGGAGTDADTLDGFDGSYYLDWANVANKPSILTLASLSVGVELTAAGDGAISYDNTSGEFRYTPPDLSTYLTSVPAQTFASLTSKPTTLSGYGITDAQATLVSATNIKTINGTSLLGSGNITIAAADGGIALTDLSVGTEGSASGNGAIAYNDSTGVFTYTPPVVPAVLTDLGITDGSLNQVLTTNGSGTFTFTTPASGVTTFSALSDVTTASIDIGKIYEPAIAMLRVDNVGTSAYTFPSHYSGNNPTIYAISGTTIAFDLDAIAGHPFEIQDNTLSALTSNLVHVTSNGTVSTNSAAQGKSSGTLYWRIPEGSPGTYVYQCQSHASMFGTVTVKDLSNI
jgi:plastocyanin